MKIEIEDVRVTGNNLIRPAGVMAADDGSIYATDAKGCCSRTVKGQTAFFGTLGGTPNGLCLDNKGNCIIANIANGQVQLLSADGTQKVLLDGDQGSRMYMPNFPFLDFHGRLWITCSVDDFDADPSMQPGSDGCLILIDNDKEPKIVVEGIFFPNGVALDKEEKFVYIAEMMLRRIVRFPINDDSSLGPGEVYGPAILGLKAFPMGIAFDEAENLWITFTTTNSIGFINPGGELEMYLEDPQGLALQSPAGICFGGKDRKTAFIGSMGESKIPCFPVPNPGLRLVHQAG
ncbi:MAG: SMP-30/gluconolactonase/LRE family protein [Smithella sp.]